MNLNTYQCPNCWGYQEYEEQNELINKQEKNNNN